MKYAATIIRLLFLALFAFLMAQGKMVLWLALFGISLLAALLFGRIYCGYVCPMNTLMIPTNWIAKKLNIQTQKTPKSEIDKAKVYRKEYIERCEKNEKV